MIGNLRCRYFRWRRGDTTVNVEMSDPGSFPFEQNPQPSDVPPPGWYFAQGDPPGTERYWGGAAWEGTYRAVGGFSPTEVVKPVTFPGWVKVVVWVLSVMKVLPLVLLALLVALWGSITAEIQDDVDFEFRDFSLIILAVGIAVIVVGVVLLLGQLVSVSKAQPGRAAVWAGILTVLDGLTAIGSFDGGGAIGPSLTIGVFVMQGSVFAMMCKVWSDRRNVAI